MKLRLIGDIHGKFAAYKAITVYDASVDFSIQIGDFGFKEEWSKLIRHKINPDKHKIIPGNHDDYSNINEKYTFNNKGYGLIDWYCGKDWENKKDKIVTTEDTWFKFFFVRGAWSIDHHMRVPNVSWWAEEEISYKELGVAVDLYEKIKPDIMITHECPIGISKQLFNTYHYPSRTASALYAMWQIHQPKLWIFGHWHKTGIRLIKHTNFICLGELNYVDYYVNESLEWNINEFKKKIKKF